MVANARGLERPGRTWRASCCSARCREKSTGCRDLDRHAVRDDEDEAGDAQLPELPVRC